MLSLLFPTMVEVGGLFGDVPHEGHLDGVARLFGDAEIMRSAGGVLPPQAAKAFIGRERAHWRTHHFGMWFFRDMETGLFAGWGGIRRGEIAGTDAVELTCALAPKHLGQGRATEITQLATQLGFENLGLAEIASLTAAGDAKSEGVLLRCGYVFERPVERADAAQSLYLRRRPTAA